MKQQLIKILSIVLLAGVFSACNKEKLLEKAIHVNLEGYNTGNEVLEFSIDTVVYRKNPLAAKNYLSIGKTYSYFPEMREAMIRIKEKQTGKEIWSKQLNLTSGELEVFFPVVIVNGQNVWSEPPAANPATNKLGFYVHYPQSTELIDIYMKNDAGQLAYLAKNVKPGQFVYRDYTAATGFTDVNKDYPVYFVKAGTTNNWAFGSENLSRNQSQLLVPRKADTKGKVQAYFVTPGSWSADVARLFKFPKERY